MRLKYRLSSKSDKLYIRYSFISNIYKRTKKEKMSTAGLDDKIRV
jgi:hypothetical protein